MFDTQIQRIFEMINEQLEKLRDIQPQGQVVCTSQISLLSRCRLTVSYQTHFVISGGLGSSQYVQDRIQEEYGLGRGPQILISDEP